LAQKGEEKWENINRRPRLIHRQFYTYVNVCIGELG
jgi:hypothetical protein